MSGFTDNEDAGKVIIVLTLSTQIRAALAWLPGFGAFTSLAKQRR
jgi:hypothetical protein